MQSIGFSGMTLWSVFVDWFIKSLILIFIDVSWEMPDIKLLKFPSSEEAYLQGKVQYKIFFLFPFSFPKQAIVKDNIKSKWSLYLLF